MSAEARGVQRGAVIGALLAGGASRRMGTHKAGVRWRDGVTLGEQVEHALLSVCDQVVVLGHGEGLPRRGGRLRMEDADPGGGPLSAIATLLSSGMGERYIVAPCDMPGLDASALTSLVAACSDTRPAAFVDASGRAQPLPVCLPAAAAADVRALVASGERRLGALAATLSFVRVPIPGDEAAVLRNVNRPEDLLPAATAVDAPPEGAPPSAASATSEPSATSDSTAAAPRMSHQVPVTRHGPVSGVGSDQVAVETPLQILLGTAPIAVLMRTPGHDRELVTGFLLSEGIITRAGDLDAVAPCEDVELPAARGNVVRADLGPGVTVDIARVTRAAYVGSSCGICGQASIERALAIRGAVQRQPTIPPDALLGLPERLRAQQATFALTGGLHAAALFDQQGQLIVVREDVGRHNAVDKVLGFAARASLPRSELGMFVSGRISFEIVQKAMASGVGLVAGVSAPTSLAIELAAQGGVALFGFVRGGRATRY